MSNCFYMYPLQNLRFQIRCVVKYMVERDITNYVEDKFNHK